MIEVFVVLARGCVVFVAMAGFLFGQLFFGQFEINSTLAGGFGIIAVLTSSITKISSQLLNIIVMLCFVIALLGVGLHIYEYYANRPVNSGSYYPWILTGPYLVCIVFLFWHNVTSSKKTARRFV